MTEDSIPKKLLMIYAHILSDEKIRILSTEKFIIGYNIDGILPRVQDLFKVHKPVCPLRIIVLCMLYKLVISIKLCTIVSLNLPAI